MMVALIANFHAPLIVLIACLVFVNNVMNKMGGI